MQHAKEIERWGRVYSFPLICCPFILWGSDQRCVSRSSLHILDGSLPGVPQTAPLCLGKLERELIVFKVPWQESDAHGRWVLSRHRQLGAQHQRMPAVSRFRSSSPRCKTGHERCFIGQWLRNLWDSEAPHHDNTLHGALWCPLKRCAGGLEISSAVSLLNLP